MNFFELNKVFGALLLSLIIAMVVGMVSSFIFSTDLPEKPGFEIAVASADGAAAPAKEAEPEVDFATLLASADPAKGEKLTKKCAACHTFDQGGKNKVGPNLFGIVGRQPGGLDGFKFSAAMQAYGEGKSLGCRSAERLPDQAKRFHQKDLHVFCRFQKRQRPCKHDQLSAEPAIS